MTMDTLVVHDAHLPLPVRRQDRLHRRLSSLNQYRLLPGFPATDWDRQNALMTELRCEERAFLEGMRAEIAEAAAAAPTDARDFLAWFEGLKENGPGQTDPLFPWLAEHATRQEMCWFLTQEVAGEAGFEDLVALTQVKLPKQAKLELARNYWDEMGRGNVKGMHGPMLEALSTALNLRPSIEETVWESLALANTMAGLAANRCYAYHAVGALGVIELTAPGRSVFVATGLKRLGVKADDRHYFDLHAVLDVKHSVAWNKEVIIPLVTVDPRIARAIAEGALMRLTCGARCFARYRETLRVRPVKV
jgi:Iron-containing redox enzyme